jgi:toluene monooxygenase system ferredoxin subunit
LWTFDICSGKGVNPSDCALAQYPVKVDGEDIYVDVEGIEPLFAHT